MKVHGVLESYLTAKIFLNLVITVVWIPGFTELWKACSITVVLAAGNSMYAIERTIRNKQEDPERQWNGMPVYKNGGCSTTETDNFYSPFYILQDEEW